MSGKIHTGKILHHDQDLVWKYGLQDFQQRLAPRFPTLSMLGVLGIVFIAMALKAKTLAGSPFQMLYIPAPLSLLYTLSFLISTVVGRLLLPREDPIALAVAINAFGARGAETALVIAMAYIIQVQAAAWYVRFTDRIYETPLEAVSALRGPAGVVNASR